MSSKYVDLVKKLNEEFEDEKYRAMEQDSGRGLFDEEEDDIDADDDIVDEEDEDAEVDTDIDTDGIIQTAQDEAMGAIDDAEKEALSGGDEDIEEAEEEEDVDLMQQGEEDLDFPLYMMLDLMQNTDNPKAKEALVMINTFFKTKIKPLASTTFALADKQEKADDKKKSPMYLFNMMKKHFADVQQSQKNAK